MNEHREHDPNKLAAAIGEAIAIAAAHEMAIAEDAARTEAARYVPPVIIMAHNHWAGPFDRMIQPKADAERLTPLTWADVIDWDGPSIEPLRPIKPLPPAIAARIEAGIRRYAEHSNTPEENQQ